VRRPIPDPPSVNASALRFSRPRSQNGRLALAVSQRFRTGGMVRAGLLGSYGPVECHGVTSYHSGAEKALSHASFHRMFAISAHHNPALPNRPAQPPGPAARSGRPVPWLSRSARPDSPASHRVAHGLDRSAGTRRPSTWLRGVALVASRVGAKSRYRVPPSDLNRLSA
jgi:hypothetical protein